MKILSIILLLALTVAGQTTDEMKAKAKAAKIKDLVITYDKFKDRSIITTKPQNLIGSWEGGAKIFAAGMVGPVAGPAQTILFVQAGYQYVGNILKETPVEYTLAFTSASKSWVYLKGDNNLYVLCDGLRIELHPVGKDSDVNLGMFYDVSVSETIGFVISRTDLDRIANANIVELKLGDSRPRKWKPEWSKRIQGLLTLTTVQK